mmetsp:Transcript_48230/g.153986  ORF Transcript_48230/g.153986 Transcript_48230/m.153986 type:complete len:153 (-) Transcript_48230:172-630(-)
MPASEIHQDRWSCWAVTSRCKQQRSRAWRQLQKHLPGHGRESQEPRAVPCHRGVVALQAGWQLVGSWFSSCTGGLSVYCQSNAGWLASGGCGLRRKACVRATPATEFGLQCCSPGPGFHGSLWSQSSADTDFVNVTDAFHDTRRAKPVLPVE